jgi:hypothetical protein
MRGKEEQYRAILLLNGEMHLLCGTNRFEVVSNANVYTLFVENSLKYQFLFVVT